jgi:hypothetical protein
MSTARLHLLSILFATAAVAALNGALPVWAEAVAGLKSTFQAAGLRTTPNVKPATQRDAAHPAVMSPRVESASANDRTFAMR